VADPVVAGFTFRADVIGGKEVAERFARVGDNLRDRLRKEMRDIGQGIVDDAQANVPVDEGDLRKSIKVRVGKTRGRRFVEDPGGLAMKVWPNSRVSHLIERGVSEKVIKVYKKASALKLVTDKRGRQSVRNLRVRDASTYMYERRHHITPEPFFMPAVDRAGDIPVRLQNVINRLVGETK
jgi:transcriptional regulator of met regulon